MTDTKGLYIHIPFCRRRCNYCDFTSYADKYDVADKYFDKLISEISSHPGYNVDTIYFGGGTPSSVDEDFIRRTLDTAFSCFNVERDAEITIEVNPESVNGDKLRVYRDMGINRISMGAQSFVDDELFTLGRLHTAKDIEDKYNLIRKAGFDNVSLDLMFGLPGQTKATLDVSIDKILSLAPEHISCYALKIEEGTPFYCDMISGRITPADDDTSADLYEHICTRLTEGGYIQYEISNFALRGRESRHNSRYWCCEEYMGVGAGASSYLDGVRSKNTSDLLTYHNEIEETLTTEDKMSEFMIFGLRLTDEGISETEFKNRFGVSIDEVFASPLNKYKRFITREGGVLKLTKDAYYISNAILGEFLL